MQSIGALSVTNAGVGGQVIHGPVWPGAAVSNTDDVLPGQLFASHLTRLGQIAWCQPGKKADSETMNVLNTTNPFVGSFG